MRCMSSRLKLGGSKDGRAGSAVTCLDGAMLGGSKDGPAGSAVMWLDDGAMLGGSKDGPAGSAMMWLDDGAMLGGSRDGPAGSAKDGVAYRLNGSVRPSNWPKKVGRDQPGLEGWSLW